LPLNDVLAAMGMHTAFGPAPDFIGLADLKPLFIHGVLQQVFIDVDEIGTEAAGLAALTIEGGAGPPDLESSAFHADHPFMYVIRDERAGEILFMGRVVHPATWRSRRALTPP
jgi:serpin B